MKHFNKEDTIMLLIDHQVGTINFAANRPKEMIISRAKALARVAKALNIPVVLTTSLEDQMQGLLLPEIQKALPIEYANRIKRTGITNAWDDENYKAAVLKAAGERKNIIMAGLTNDVCIVYPSISMVEEGFDVQVVIDAGGSLTQIADDLAQQTWEKAGVRTTAINQLIAELTSSWETEDGGKLVAILAEDIIPTFGKFK
ncbi:MAG: isochorismatase family protein [Gloeobacteraceae cyanobacterium ES-bin-316]|nr:isochorismatase family protein [Ferruginibacter sp.]